MEEMRFRCLIRPRFNGPCAMSSSAGSSRKRLRGGINRRLAQCGNQLLLRRRKPHNLTGDVFTRAIFNRRADNRMQHRLHAGKMFREKRAGKFHGEKLVRFFCRALRRERLGLAMIKARCARCEFRPRPAAFHEAVAGKIQAQLDAARMKTGGPVKFALRKKVVPLDAVTCAVETAENWLPAFADIAPRFRLGEWHGLTTGISG